MRRPGDEDNDYVRNEALNSAMPPEQASGYALAPGFIEYFGMRMIAVSLMLPAM
jgi:hypothetical protein